MTGPIHVDGWLDVACPWCWVAKRRFELAVSELGGNVTIEYHSFELAPDLPDDYLSTEADFLRSFHGGKTDEQVRTMMWVVRTTGARLGLAYDFDAVQHTNTFLAHQLLHHARAYGRQLPVLDVLFSAFFERGRNLSRVEELVVIAAGVGMDSSETRKAIGSGRYAGAVRADRQLARSRGVASIPTYIVAGQQPIHGAKRPAVLVGALRRAAEQRVGD